MMSWLWLACGAALLPFTLLQTTIAPAVWLAPLLLLRFSRTVPARWALPALAVVGAVATYVSFRGALSDDRMLIVAAGGAILTPVPYAVDRLLRGRLWGIGRTLVFPMADTTLTFLAGNGDFGTMGHVAGTQVGNLPLLQTVSVTGQWGIAFLICWAAAVANELWERRPGLRRTLAVYGTVLVAVLVLGGARVALDPPSGPTVRITGLAPNRALTDARTSAAIAPGARTAPERAAIRDRWFTPLVDDLIARTQSAARDGAQIVVWAEAAAYEFVEDQAALLERARTVARTEGIYLQIGVVHLLPRAQRPFVDIRAILIDPQGVVLWDYLKMTSPLNDGSVPGPGVLPTADTPYGRLSTVICFDASFPTTIRQAGRSGVDILLVPSSDWEQVTDALAEQAVLRAVENGVSVVRPAGRGTSLAVDYHGRVLGRDAGWFTSDSRTTDHAMTVSVPVDGVGTPYGRFTGDVFAWLSIVGLLGAAAVAFVRWRRSRTRQPVAAATPDTTRPPAHPAQV